MLLEPLQDTTVVAPGDAILECDIDVGEPEAEIKWFVFLLFIFCMFAILCIFLYD